ncbi:ABC transporter permease [Micromonospora sp. NPDC000089]|uniref:ABC transporter permease n=1 Tax=unclassified Micromonospora TaxID=2617518 RepID=UPI0036740103
MGYDEPGRGGAVAPSSGVPATMLQNVFDDPEHGEPGQDRVGVHLLWETLLLAALVALGYLLWRQDADALRGDRLRDLLVNAVALGLLALAAGLSLRTAAVNLAVGPVAVAAALHFAEQGDRGMAAALTPALIAAALGGLALAWAVVVLHVPGWAASLAAASGVVVWIERRDAPVTVQGDYDPHRAAFYLFAGFAAVAVLGGIFGALRAVRRLVGRFRPVADPARRRGVAAAVVTAAALTGSTVLAMLGGLLLAANSTGPVVPDPGLDWTVLAVGVALLAGTSAYGRRGGLFGTLIAVCLVVVFQAWVAARGWTVNRWTVGAAALALGLVATRLVESFGRPRAATVDRVEYVPAGDGTISAGWSLPGPSHNGDWPPVPPQSTATPPDPWQAPRWDTGGDRWDTGGR